MAVKQWCFCVGLSPNKKSIFGLRTQIVFIVLALCFVAGVSSFDSNISCSNVRSIFESKGILSATDVQDLPTSDAGELCQNRGCCTASSRSKLMQHARTQLESAMRVELNKLAEILANRAKRFDEFFRKLLQQSREEFHAMFKRTYGMIYEQHSYVFEQLFQQLESYYTKGDTDLDSMMDNFFGILYQKMFKVLNSQYNVDDKYLKCVSEHMRDTQPFDDVPHKLSVQLRRAFVATRTFHKALRHGAEVVRNMQQVAVTQECVVAWSRLRYCGQCGHSSPPPPACSRYCHNVLRGCLPAHADLAPHWDAYVDAVEKVADRLLGPFNIVMVVEPIDIKISEAIMNFQEHNQEISQKIFAGCGKPALGGAAPAAPFFNPDRSRRSIRSQPDIKWSNQRHSDVDDFELEASFESLMKDPLLYRLGSRNELKETTKKLSHQAEDRQKFLQYLRGDVDAEEYEDHERRRREAEPEPALSTEIDYRAFEFGEKKEFGGKKGKKTVNKADVPKDSTVHEWGSPALERLVRETRSRVRNSRRYWANLPYLLCSEQSVAAAPAAHATCFNGTALASYTLSAAGEGSAALASNPEVRGLVGGLNQVAAQQEALKMLTTKLKDAYNGVEIQWRDDDDLQYGSSSLEITETGSGSGSGDDSDDLPDDDEDNERDIYPASGQGPSPTDYDEPTPVETEVNPPAPPASEVPYTPYVVPGGESEHNVHMTGTVDEDLTPDLDTPEEPRASIPVETPEVKQVPEVKNTPVAASAHRPSLEKALFTYALPVVCAWFGGLVTDFF